MKKFGQIIIGLLFLSNMIYGQDIHFGIQSGIGFYRMQSFHKLNESIASTLPSDDAITSDFPPYVYFQAEADLGFIDNKFSIGIVASTHSTGSRIYYSDYSGKYSYDNVLLDYTLGTIFKARLFRFSKIDINTYAEFGFSSTTLTTDEYFQIGNDFAERRQTYDSSPAYFEPGFRFVYNFNKLNIGLNMGYALNIQDTFTVVGNEIVIFTNPVTGESIQSDWTGFRLGITASFKLFTIRSHHPAKQ